MLRFGLKDPADFEFKNLWPHLLLVSVVVGYALIGAAIFSQLESEVDYLARKTVTSKLKRNTRNFVRFLQKYDRERHVNRKRAELKLRTLIMQYEDALLQHKVRSADVFDSTDGSGAVYLTTNRWSFGSSLLFSFTVMTTIGYGHIAPITFSGRLFCIFYGVIGIPLTIIAIADIGKFLAEAFELLFQKLRTACSCLRRKKQTQEMFIRESVSSDDDEDESDTSETTSFPALVLLLVFSAYIIIGAVCLPLWENMDFFTGCYFSFVTLTTCGFGDVVPKHERYLFPTLLYITLGLSITTLAIDVCANYFRKLHYIGAKITNAKNALIWFGNKVLTVGDIVRSVGRQYGVPQREIDSLLNRENFDMLMETAVQEKQQASSSKKLKKTNSAKSNMALAPLFYDSEFRYIDEDSYKGSSNTLRIEYS